MSRPRILVLGGRDAARQPAISRSNETSFKLGWHLSQLSEAATRHDAEILFADYESLRGHIAASNDQANHLSTGQAGHATAWCYRGDGETAGEVSLSQFDAILTRTMPAGSLEQVTFRLAVLHDLVSAKTGPRVINSPRGLELAIDKFATLTLARRLELPTPRTQVVQSRTAAMEAFEQLGGDVVVKPIFGGEGRGVMRLRDTELAWTVFSTLTQMDAVCYLQEFVGPGGVDLRVLIVGDHAHAVRRTSENDFRTNVRGGGQSTRVELLPKWESASRLLCRDMGLTFAAFDWIESATGELQLIEVNGIPGWKGAQKVVPVCIADQIIEELVKQS
ncbi:ATP-grasp domain-containing protein [Rhodopirellula sp. JC740]|uniref:ATP-grasp domain-containing protein n=1 Tax=Rhodopirellula halodulae TaxID=2894198 RepID=A0ABS8NFT9_9BACT|nr:ATP-grasp domain-containing protein [Rhodopirellula sp. JC740]MCC9641336.1 ATP-grasp domain-containing protein [Rhodopirellula sp. JC740]